MKNLITIHTNDMQKGGAYNSDSNYFDDKFITLYPHILETFNNDVFSDNFNKNKLKNISNNNIEKF